jgi:glycosyltransferase involved in cell wall biosynthesis
MKRILFLWDAEAFGGHDVSALVALERLAAMPELHVGALHTGRNVRLVETLARIASPSGRLDVVKTAAAPCVSESLDGLLHGPRSRSIGRAVYEWQPDLAVNVQGFITLGLCALGACRALGIPLISFLPMAHRVRILRPSPISLLQDTFNRWSYAVPTAFITTSERVKMQLVQLHGVPATRVAVAEYGPDVLVALAGDRATDRTRFGFHNNARVVGLIGRVEFSQKRQDFLIRAIARYRTVLNGFQFAIVGDGPDLPVAQQLAARHRIGDRLLFLPWQQDMSRLYPALDAVLIPSRYEGVPLVMLEAMARRIPVIASNVDGMADVLPPECLFAPNDAIGMITRLRALPEQPGAAVLDSLAHQIATRFNTAVFCTRFAEALTRLMRITPED